MVRNCGSFTKYKLMIERVLKQAAKQRPKGKIKTERIYNDSAVLSDILLGVLTVVGVVPIGLIAPNLFSSIAKLSKTFKRLTKEQQVEKLTNSFYYLKRTGKITLENGLKGLFVRLTKKGKKKLTEIDYENLQIPHSIKWDKKWWQVAADIPTKEFKLAADAFRHKLLNMNFCSLQRSLWYYPFDPRKELEFVLTRFGLEKFVTVMEINRMDRQDEKILKMYFKKAGIL